MNDDLTLLASTYLDGEATLDERARVEADPSLLAEVERLRDARATLSDARWFERPGDDVREAAIAAALTAWDVSATGMTTTQAAPVARRAPVVAFERRRAYTRWLTAAAAIVAVAGLGVVMAQFGGSDNQDESAAFDAPADTIGRAETGDQLTEQVEPSSEADRTFASAEAPADDAGGADSDSAASEETSSAAPAAPTASGDSVESQVNLVTPEELGTFAAEAQAAFESDAERDVLSRPCADEAFDAIETYIALGTYRGRSVMIGIDEDRERAVAVDPGTCEIVAEAALP